MRELFFLKPVSKLENAVFLDPLIKEVQRVIDVVLKPRALEDLLHGVPTGHPAHPVLVQIPVGTWTSAALLDLLPGTARASRFLVGVGVVSSAAAIFAGWADWARTRPQQQRVGIVHAAVNEAGTVLYALSWLDRRFGSETRGRLVGFGAYTLIGVGGYLGGHLGYRQAVGANHAEAVVHRFPKGWQVLGPLDDLPEERPVRRDVAGEPLLVLRRGGRIDAISNVCTHLGEPLDQGVFDDSGHSATITEAQFGTVIDIETGEVVHGPATAPQPRFETRINGELVEVRLPESDLAAAG